MKYDCRPQFKPSQRFHPALVIRRTARHITDSGQQTARNVLSDRWRGFPNAGGI